MHQRQNALGFALGIVLLVACGLALRFTNLGLKLYWHDEVLTSITSAGYTQAELTSELIAAPEITPEMLLRYQKPKPGSGPSDVNRALAEDHVPLYYLVSRLWMELVGESPAAMRALAALISVLALPCVFWLGLELFQSKRTAWLAVGLMCVSPFFVLYAQEARPYSLWLLVTALSSAAFLRALRCGRNWRWAVYAATAALGFLSHFLFALVIAVHGLYLVILRLCSSGQQRPSIRASVSFLVAAGFGVLAVLPWLVLRLAPLAGDLAFDWWLSRPKPWGQKLRDWIGAACDPFMDIDAGLAVKTVLGVLVLILVAYALVWLLRRTRLQTWAFVYLLVGVPAGSLLILDLVLGGQRSTHARFLTPSLFGLLLAVAHLLASQTDGPPGGRRKGWQAVTIALVCLSLFSSVTIVRAESWWNKGGDQERWQVVRAINAAERPLVFMREPTSGETAHLLVLGHYLKAEVRIVLGAEALAGDHAGAGELFWLNWPADRAGPPTELYGFQAEKRVDTVLWHLQPIAIPDL